MSNPVEELAARIEAIEWGQDESRGRLHARLGREYLRRAALWAQALGKVDEWPFFDIAEVIDPDVNADGIVLRRVREHLEDVKASWWGKRIAEWALQFAALPSVPQDLPNPYEPLIVMFERGGDFTTETGFMNIDYVFGMPMRGWRDHLSEEPVIGLSRVELDAVEAGL